MRKLVLVALATAALAGSSSWAAVGGRVTITREGFVPTGTTIRVGNAVTWTNADTIVHHVQFDKYPECNLTIQPSQSATCTFARVGYFIYNDPTLSETPRGSVDVLAENANTSIAVARARITYGEKIAITGKVTSGAGGEDVLLTARGYEDLRFKVLKRM